jgi:excisionase family DNA binding protein
MPRDPYQTVKEVADRLIVSEATVRGWIKDESLRAIYIGKRWRMADVGLRQFLPGHQTCERVDACVPVEPRDTGEASHEHEP